MIERTQRAEGTETTEKRLAKLEREIGRVRRENRFLKGGVVTFLAMATCLAIMGAGGKDHQKEVRAEKFVVTNSSGMTRAVIEGRVDGRSGLEIRDSAWRVVLRVPADEE
jgi:hypothetical protein